MGRPKKRIILFLVEGISDVHALERPITKLLEDNAFGIQSVFLSANTDVTSDSRNNPDNILDSIYRHYLMPFFRSNPYYYPKDIAAVVQICDLDGTFIPRDNCKQFTDRIFAETGFLYVPPYVYGPSEDIVISRNNKKADNITFLLKQDTIKVKTKTVPYSLYFFSANIDHYLVDDPNLDPRDKVQSADSFADKYDSDPSSFVAFFDRNPYSIQGKNYTESWDYITCGTGSVERHTNFNLFVDALYATIFGGDGAIPIASYDA